MLEPNKDIPRDSDFNLSEVEYSLDDELASLRGAAALGREKLNQWWIDKLRQAKRGACNGTQIRDIVLRSQDAQMPDAEGIVTGLTGILKGIGDKAGIEKLERVLQLASQAKKIEPSSPTTPLASRVAELRAPAKERVVTPEERRRDLLIKLIESKDSELPFSARLQDLLRREPSALKSVGLKLRVRVFKKLLRENPFLRVGSEDPVENLKRFLERETTRRSDPVFEYLLLEDRELIYSFIAGLAWKRLEKKLKNCHPEDGASKAIDICAWTVEHAGALVALTGREDSQDRIAERTRVALKGIGNRPVVGLVNHWKAFSKGIVELWIGRYRDFADIRDFLVSHADLPGVGTVVATFGRSQGNSAAQRGLIGLVRSAIQLERYKCDDCAMFRLMGIMAAYNGQGVAGDADIVAVSADGKLFAFEVKSALFALKLKIASPISRAGRQIEKHFGLRDFIYNQIGVDCQPAIIMYGPNVDTDSEASISSANFSQPIKIKGGYVPESLSPYRGVAKATNASELRSVLSAMRNAGKADLLHILQQAS